MGSCASDLAHQSPQVGGSLFGSEALPTSCAGDAGDGENEHYVVSYINHQDDLKSSLPSTFSDSSLPQQGEADTGSHALGSTTLATEALDGRGPRFAGRVPMVSCYQAGLVVTSTVQGVASSARVPESHVWPFNSSAGAHLG